MTGLFCRCHLLCLGWFFHYFRLSLQGWCVWVWMLVVCCLVLVWCSLYLVWYRLACFVAYRDEVVIECVWYVVWVFVFCLRTLGCWWGYTFFLDGMTDFKISLVFWGFLWLCLIVSVRFFFFSFLIFCWSICCVCWCFLLVFDSRFVEFVLLFDHSFELELYHGFLRTESYTCVHPWL